MNSANKISVTNKQIPPRNARIYIAFVYLVVLILPLFISQQPRASDFALEESIASQLVKNKSKGSGIWLKTGDQQFFSLYMESLKPDTQGAVILLPGIAAHPDWPDVISPLRTSLPEYGWSTLSLQLPILAPAASVAEYVPLLNEAAPRIISAIKFLQSKGFDNLVIIGHGLGATMGASFLASGSASASAIKAFAGIGMGVHRDYPEFVISKYLVKIKIPIYDLYGSKDLDNVMYFAEARFLSSRRSRNKAYRQRSIVGADHFFRGRNEALINRIKSWLKKFAPGVTADAKQAELSSKKKEKK